MGKKIFKIYVEKFCLSKPLRSINKKFNSGHFLRLDNSADTAEKSIDWVNTNKQRDT